MKYKLPPPIPDTPDNIARAIMAGPPKKNWDFLKTAGRKRLRPVSVKRILGKLVYIPPK